MYLYSLSAPSTNRTYSPVANSITAQVTPRLFCMNMQTSAIHERMPRFMHACQDPCSPCFVLYDACAGTFPTSTSESGSGKCRASLDVYYTCTHHLHIQGKRPRPLDFEIHSVVSPLSSTPYGTTPISLKDPIAAYVAPRLAVLYSKMSLLACDWSPRRTAGAGGASDWPTRGHRGRRWSRGCCA